MGDLAGSAIRPQRATVEWITLLLPIAVILIGMSVVVGSLLHIKILTSIVPNMPSMKFNTAVGLILLGISLIACERKFFRLSFSLAIAVLILGSATLVEYTLGIQLYIDEFVVLDVFSTDSSLPPGRMSPITALSFVTFSVGQIGSIKIPSKHLLWQGAVLVTLFLSVVSFLGRLYNASELAKLYPYTNVALNTITCFLLLCLSFLFSKKNMGFALIFLSSRAGGKMLRRLLPASLVMIFSLGLLSMLGSYVGIFDQSFERVFIVTFSLSTLAWLMTVNARRLNTLDDAVHRQMELLEESNRLLEEKVRIRTKELEAQNAKIGGMAERMQNLIELAPVGIFEADLSGRYSDVNRAGCETLGYTRDEIVGKTIEELIPPDEVSRLAESRVALSVPGAVHTGEWQLRRKDGTYVDVEVSAKIITGGRWLGFALDITERKKAERELKEAEQNYKVLFDGAYDAILVADSDGKIIAINDRLVSKFEYESGELCGKPVEVLLPERYRERHARYRALFASDPRPREMGARTTLYGRKKSGIEFPVEISLGAAWNRGTLRITAIIRDVTEKVKIELQKTFLAETSKILNEVIDYDGRIERIAEIIVPSISDICVVSILENDALHAKAVSCRDPALKPVLKEVSSYTPRANIPYSTGAMFESGDALRIEKVDAEFLKASNMPEEHRQRFSRLNVTSYLALPLVARGKKVGALTLAMTDSSRVFLKDDLPFYQTVATRCAMAIDNSRLYSEAQRAASARENVLFVVSHDLKNPLSSISLSAETLLEGDLEANKVHAIASKLKVSAEQMQRLVKDLLDLGKLNAGTLTLQKINAPINALIDEGIEPYASKIAEKKLAIFREVAPGVDEIVCDRGRIVQVFWNLIGNAVKFSPPAGKIFVKVTKVQDSLQFSIRDEGPGISAAEIGSVFDRFWQAAKTASLGTGLGLSIVKGIVEAHHGKVWVESEYGKGSDFQFTLPVEAPAVEHERGIADNEQAPRVKQADIRGLRVLVVDDNDEIRFFLRHFLKKAGAEAIEARSVEDAFEIISKQEPDVVITDIELQGATGYDILKRLRDPIHSPKNYIPVAALTGHSDAREIQKINEAGFDLSLSKPVSLNTLVTSIAKMMENRPRHSF